MLPRLMLIHGMGVTDPDWMEKDLKNFSQIIKSENLSLFYGDVVMRVPMYILGQQEQIPIRDEEEQQENDREKLALGWGMARLGLDEDASSIALQGQALETGAQIAFNTYSFALRYLARCRVRNEVFERVTEQVQEYTRREGVAEGSIVLVAHSLGTVISLDILDQPDLAKFFRQYISLGSPLGLIAASPLNKWLLRVRRSPVPWVDVKVKGDFFPRISSRRGFNAKVMPSVEVKDGYVGHVHSAYFGSKAVLENWTRWLDLN